MVPLCAVHHLVPPFSLVLSDSCSWWHWRLFWWFSSQGARCRIGVRWVTPFSDLAAWLHFSPALSLRLRDSPQQLPVASSVPQSSASTLGGNRGISWVARRPQAHICLSLVRLGTDWMMSSLRAHIHTSENSNWGSVAISRGWETGEGGLEVEEGEDTCTPMANSCWWTWEKKPRM